MVDGVGNQHKQLVQSGHHSPHSKIVPLLEHLVIVLAHLLESLLND
jgi:hypothetical protein